MKSKLTYTQIAEEAGLSVMSVSNVLRTPDRVRPETRERVHRAIRKLGGVLREEATDRDKDIVTPRPHRRIRFLSSGVSAALLEVPVYSRLFQGAINAADAADFNLSFSNFDTPVQIQSKGYCEQVDGLILMGDWQHLKEPLPVPVVTLMSTRYPFRTHHVGYSLPSVGLLVAETFLEQGLKRLAYVGPDDRDRHASFHQKIEESGGSCQRIFTPGAYQLQGGSQIVDSAEISRAVATLLEHDLPEGVFLHSDQVAAVFRTSFLEHGLPMNQLPFIIGCNNDPQFVQLLGGGYRTVSIGIKELARLAIQRICEISRDPLTPVQKILIEPRLITF
jgi:DNA-binding LacI/PurR family transcriptional regulator